MQVLSGVAPGGRTLEIDFADMAFGTGDNDFQDVVLSVFTDRNDVFLVQVDGPPWLTYLLHRSSPRIC